MDTGQRRRAVVIAVSAVVVLAGAVVLWPGGDASNAPAARPSLEATPSEGADVPQEMPDAEATARLEAQPDDHDPQLPETPASSYADDDDSDEAAIWRLKQQHQQWLEDEHAEGSDNAISSSTTIDMAMPTSDSITLYLEQDGTPDQASR